MVMAVCDKYLHIHTQIYIVYDIVGKVLKQAIKEDVYTTRAVTIKHRRVCACVRKIQHSLPRNSGLKMCLVDVEHTGCFTKIAHPFIPPIKHVILNIIIEVFKSTTRPCF